MRKSNRRKKVDRPNPPEFLKKKETVDGDKRTLHRTDSFSISWGPLYSVSKVSDETKDALIDVYFSMQKKPTEALDSINELLDKHSDIPMLHDLLGIIKIQLGQQEEAIEIFTGMSEKFPDYLFAKLAQAENAFLREDWEQIPEIFADKFSFREQVPDRNSFHIVEALHFYFIMGRYYAYTKNIEEATANLDKIKKLDPKHFFGKLLETEINKAAKVGIFKRAFNKIKRKST
ncbi:MAG: hypothetical protein AAF518_25340 [Spirochaetota bacterium]